MAEPRNGEPHGAADLPAAQGIDGGPGISSTRALHGADQPFTAEAPSSQARGTEGCAPSSAAVTAGDSASKATARLAGVGVDGDTPSGRRRSFSAADCRSGSGSGSGIGSGGKSPASGVTRSTSSRKYGVGSLSMMVTAASFRFGSRSSPSHAASHGADEQADARARLAKGFVCTKHGRAGAPQRRFVYADASVLYCLKNARERAKYERAQKRPAAAFALSQVQEVVRGRTTSVFARSRKYYADDSLDALESRCLSVMLPGRSWDLEMDSLEERDELATLLAEMLQVPLSTPVKGCDDTYPRGGDGLSGTVYRMTYNVIMERFILACIVGNIIIMAIGSPLELEHNHSLEATLGAIELVFSIIFTIEMFLRIIALEGVMPYLRDPWNALDAIIVVGGWVTELPFMTSFNFSALRAFRALRVLRTIKFLQGIREILETFGATLGMVAQAMLVFFYFLFLFSVLGIELFGDALNHRCTADGMLAAPQRFCSYDQNSTLSPAAIDDMYWYVGMEGGQLESAGCPSGQYCTRWESPNGGNSGFEALGTSFLTVFRVAARPPGTSFIMRGTMQAVTDAAVVYFVLITVFVSFLVLSLFIAIVRASFSDVQKKRKAELAAAEENKVAKETPASARAHTRDTLRLDSGITSLESFGSDSKFGVETPHTRRARLRRESWNHMSGRWTSSPSPSNAALPSSRVSHSSMGSNRLDPMLEEDETEVELDGVTAAVGAAPLALGASKPPVAAVPLGADGSAGASSPAVASASPRQPSSSGGSGGSGGDTDAGVGVGVGAGVGVGVQATYSSDTTASAATRSVQSNPLADAGTGGGAPAIAHKPDNAQVAGAAGGTGGAHAAITGTSTSGDGSGASAAGDAPGVSPAQSATSATAAEAVGVTVGDAEQAGDAAGTGKTDENHRSEQQSTRKPSAARQTGCRAWMPARHKVLFLLEPRPQGCITRFTHWLVMHAWFERLLLAAIMMNTVLLAMEYHGMPRAYADFLAAAELVFTVGFTAEMCLKIVGLGSLYDYCIAPGTGWNRFDGVVVLATLADLSLGQSVGINLSLLRVFRVMRIIRVLRKNPELVHLLKAIISSMASLANLLSFMTLVIIVFAILGMQLFSGKFPPGTRSTFDYFGDSMFTLFKLLAGGGTWGIFFNALNSEAGWAAPFFFILYNTFSVFITLNFLVVIILGKFAMTEDEKTRRRKERSDLEIARHHKKRRFYSESFRHRYVLESPMDTLGVDDVAKAYAPAASPIAGDGDAEPSSSRRRRGRSAREAFAGSVRSLVRSSRNLRMSPGCRQRCWHSMMTSGMTGACVRAVRKDKTLMVFGPTNRLRLFLDKLVKSPWFERVIMLCIVVSSLTLTLESPKYDSDMLKDVLYWSDTVFLVIFCLEFIVKAIALGFMFGKYAYLQDAWNRLDFFVVIVTLASRLSGGSGAGRTLRVGRILRPLRMINRNEGMKVVINALLRSLPAVGYTVVLLVLFFFIFGILGINLFSGKFYSCSDATVRFKFECVGTYVLPNGIAVPRVWANPDFSFDNIGAAALTLLEVVALRGWVPVLNAAMDVTEVDQQPEKLNSPGSALYFIAFVFIGAFYMMRLFVGIIVSHFRQFSGTALHTDAQVQWLVMKRYITTQKPEVAPPPRYKCLPSWCGTAGRETAQRIVSHAWFEPGVTLVILLHLCFLATQSVGQAQSWTDTLELVHWVFASVYAAEQLLRMYGGGVIGYIVRDMPWSLYDLVVTAVMIIAPLAGMRTGTGIFRALRFGRVVNLLTRMKGLSRLLETLQNSLGAMANITALLCLVIFVYAVLGMQFFSTTKFGGSLNITSNFETFFQAVLTLFQIVCGEVWLTLMHDASVGLPFCTEAYGDVASDCGSPLLGPLFFFSFFILTFAVFLNLYVAAILDTYSSSQSSSEGVPWMMTLSDYNSFREVWRKFDPAGTKGIPASKLDDLMVALAEAGHPLSQTEGSALTRRVRMAFARTMIAEISGASGAKQLDTSVRRLKFVPVLLGLAMSKVSADALDTPHQVQLDVERKNVAATTIESFFEESRPVLRFWARYRDSQRRFAPVALQEANNADDGAQAEEAATDA